LVEISLTVSPVRNTEGRIIGASKIARDITERKQHEQRLKLLAREVDHRAKNMLAVVQAMVRMTRTNTVSDFVDALEGRIAALARAYASRHEPMDGSRFASPDRGGNRPL
jgi:two-component sensor histidine kinase